MVAKRLVSTLGDGLRTVGSLPRGYKRGIMVLADAVMIPAALWSAFVLKFDSWAPSLAGNESLFIVALIASIPAR